MSRRLFPCVLLGLALASLPVAGAPPVTGHPGYFPIESLGLVPSEAVEVDVDRNGPMLRMVAAALDDDAGEQAFAALIAQLERIRVQVGEPTGGAGRDEVRRRLAEAEARLDDAGWQRMVLVREDDEMVAVYVKGDDRRIDGLTVLALDDELALVNLVGSIDPRQLGRLLADLDHLPALEDLDLDDLPTAEHP